MNSSDNNDNRASASKSKVKSLIKEKKQLEKKIYRLETFYKTILDGIKSGVWVSNEDDVIVYSNKSMERIAHVNREELIGKHIYTDFPEITIKEFIKYYSKAKKSLEPVFYDNIDVLTPGMKHSFQSGWLIPVKKKEKFSKMICTVDDITKIKNIKEKLKDRESRYTAIVSSNSIGVARVDMDGRPIEINQYLHDFFGYSSEELKDIPFKDFT
ncbi:MAG: PAS domain-containing protein, partial [Promethearchaeia archaeon]